MPVVGYLDFINGSGKTHHPLPGLVSGRGENEDKELSTNVHHFLLPDWVYGEQLGGAVWPWLPTDELDLKRLRWTQPSYPELLWSGCLITTTEKQSNRYNKPHKQERHAKEAGEAAVYNLTPKSKSLKLSTPIKFSGRSRFGFYSFCLEIIRAIWALLF